MSASPEEKGPPAQRPEQPEEKGQEQQQQEVEEGVPAPLALRRNDSVLHLRGTREKLVLAMVGLPARGKTYIARKLSRYLEWLGYSSRVFNIGQYRRDMVGAAQPAAFFDPDNAEGVRARGRCAMAAMDDMLEFLGDGGGHAAVYDGSNSTSERRAEVERRLREHHAAGGAPVQLVWVESVCTDEALVLRNVRDTKATSPDYAAFDDREAAAADFLERIAMYEKGYEPVSGEEQSYVRLQDCGRRVTTNNIRGYLPTRIVFFLMNLRVGKQPIYFSRHGESVFNTVGRLGGDSPITDRGLAYAKRLGVWIAEQPEVQARPGGRLPVWCSCLKRTIMTAGEVPCAQELVQWRSLNEIDSGTCDGMTYAEIEAKYPHEFAARAADKLGYRYPEGESYRDLIRRLEPVIFELERLKGPILVVAHQAVLRCLLGYFVNVDIPQLPHMSVPLHTVLRLTAGSYGCRVEKFRLETAEGVGAAEARE